MLLEENSSRSFLIAMKREWPKDYLDIMWIMRDKAQGAPEKPSMGWPVTLLRSDPVDEKVVPITRGAVDGKKAGKAKTDL